MVAEYAPQTLASCSRFNVAVTWSQILHHFEDLSVKTYEWVQCDSEQSGVGGLA
jgi:hypothetical protein